MSSEYQTVACQRCGSGFVLTPTYIDLLGRRGAKVVVPVLCPTCFFAEGPMPKEHGEVKWFSSRKNYGFIIADNGEEVFVHQHQILDENGPLKGGQPVRFHLHYPIKGPEALNVEVIEN